MAFFRTVAFSEPSPALDGNGVILRPPQPGDFAEWAALRETSRAFLTPWEPIWPTDDLTRSAFRRRLRRYSEDQRSDQAYTFFIYRKSDSALVGGLTLANVRRGVAQTGSLGYWIGAPYTRQGYMAAAVRSMLPFSFVTLRLLEKCGFVREGYARQYLCINGTWQDHVLYARLRDDLRPQA